MQTTIPVASAAIVEQLARGTVPGSLTLSEPTLGNAKLKWWKSAEIGPGNNTETDTTFDLPAKAIVHEVLVEVKTAEATASTKTIDVGLLASESGGDADGFIDGLSVAATGLIVPKFVATVGSNNTYLGAAATHTIGALLTGVLIAGQDTADAGDGFAMKAPHFAGAVTAKSVSYKRGDTFVEFKGHIWILYSEMP